MAKRQLHPDSPWLLALLAALVALGPLSVDMYLPAMPTMMRAFDTDISHMHLTLSSYLTGFALFHLACGPLADRYGRKPILLGGTLLFVLACAGCSQSSTVEEMLLFRFLQGIGACVGPTLARAVTRDVFGPTGAARALSLIAMLMALAPAVAPTLGGVLLLVLPWPSVFMFLGGYGVLMIFLIQVFLSESLPEVQSLHPRAILRNFGELLVDPFFLTVTFCSGLIYAGLLVYLASSSFVYIDMLGVAPQYFGLIFLGSVVGYMAGSALSARLSKRQDSERIMRLGVILAICASCLLLLCSSIWPASILALMLPMMIYSIAMGLVLPHSMAIALRPFPHIAGTASALLGFIQMSLSAGTSALTGVFLTDTPQPMVWMLVIITLTSLALGQRVHTLYNRTKP
ncbi:MAG: multidrug effflux MFS transporter [Pseudomonadales bacterium]|nr:multidrug effflux MFS transporter [Halioglobus sp.]MCP5128399.1 multidrug effflux MFS transporter [Pseudomonadales bacterium]